jgi:hypothetical protein
LCQMGARRLIVTLPRFARLGRGREGPKGGSALNSWSCGPALSGETDRSSKALLVVLLDAAYIDMSNGDRVRGDRSAAHWWAEINPLSSGLAAVGFICLVANHRCQTFKT